jgi:choice-of-anchor A domain-containing protein
MKALVNQFGYFLIPFVIASSCTRSVKSTTPEALFQEEVPSNPNPDSNPGSGPGGAKPTPRPSSTPKPSPVPSPISSPSPSPKPSPTPSPKESPIACVRDGLKGLANHSIITSAAITAQGFRGSHGIVGTKIILDGAEIGYGLGRGWDRYDVVGTDIELSWTEVVNASVGYSSKLKVKEGTEIFGRYVKGKFFDSMKFFAQMDALRERVSLFPTLGKVSRQCVGSECTVNLTGTHSSLNRFELDPSIVKKRDRLVVKVPANSTPLIFFKGASVNWDDLEVSAPYESVWIAPKTVQKIKLSWLTLPGTLISPEADLSLEQTLIMGRVIGKSFTTKPCDEDTCVTVDSQERVDRVCL